MRVCLHVHVGPLTGTGPPTHSDVLPTVQETLPGLNPRGLSPGILSLSSSRSHAPGGRSCGWARPGEVPTSTVQLSAGEGWGSSHCSVGPSSFCRFPNCSGVSLVSAGMGVLRGWGPPRGGCLCPGPALTRPWSSAQAHPQPQLPRSCLAPAALTVAVELADSAEPVKVPAEATGLVGVLGSQLQLGVREGQLQPLQACQGPRRTAGAPAARTGGAGGGHLTRALSSPFHMKVSTSLTVTLT